MVFESVPLTRNGTRNSLTSDEFVRSALREVVRRFGTPTYAFDVRRMRSQVRTLREHLPKNVDLLYSLKANASLGVSEVFAEAGVGADVASAGELATAMRAGFGHDRIFVAGPFKSPETVELLREAPDAIVSIDSLSEMHFISRTGLHNAVVLRLRPDFGSCAVVPAGSESRFGLTCDQFDDARRFLSEGNLDVIGFHVFAGSQVLDTDELNDHLRRALDLSLRAAESLAIEPKYINLGGGFGIPYGPEDTALDLDRVVEALTNLASRAAPARLVLELGRFLVAEAGWYLTSVMGSQTFQGRPAVIVDGGVHQRADMCGLCLRTRAYGPIALNSDDSAATELIDVLGCLSLPDDVMIERVPLPRLSRGDVLAFANAGAYGVWSSPALFHAFSLPAEVAFDGHDLQLMRQRKPSQSILDDQRSIRPISVSTRT